MRSIFDIINQRIEPQTLPFLPSILSVLRARLIGEGYIKPEPVAGKKAYAGPFGSESSYGGPALGLTGPRDAGGLNKEFLRRLTGLLADSPGSDYITSGYRSIAEQQALWNASDKSGRMVARPGYSRHNWGIAADIGGQADYAWLKRNAPRYGLYFPLDYEPWHIEMMGSR